MNTIWQDIRYAIRIYFKNPKLAIVMIATLGIGIGSLASVFTVVNSVVFRPLSYQEPDRLFRLFENNLSQGLDFFSVSPLNWFDWRKNQSFEDLGAIVRQQDFNLGTGDRVEQVSAARVSANLFQILGATPLTGHFFSDTNDRTGGEDVVILSFPVWNSIFGKDKTIIGKTILLDQKPYRVLGITGNDFRLPFNDAGIYLPLALATESLEDRNDHFLRIIGRLKKNVTSHQAAGEMKQIAASLAAQYPDSNRGWSVVMVPLKDVVVPENFRNASWILLGAALLVLMISCFNATNLLTVKTFDRHREISIRRAIGATTSRLFSQLLTESLLIALLSGSLGILLAMGGMDLLQSLEPENIPRLKEIHIDRLAMGFAIAVSCFTVLFFGTIAARQNLKHGPQEQLKEGSIALSSGSSHRRFRNLLVILEGAFSVLLLICAVLLIKSFIRLQYVDLGFDPEPVVTLKMKAPVEKFPEFENIRSIQKTLLERVGAIPGVQSAAIANLVPMSPGNSMLGFSTMGPPRPGLPNVFSAAYRIVSPEYFKTMGIRLLKGQGFSESSSGKTLIIDEFAWRMFLGGREPIGMQIYLSGFTDSFQVIGIAHSVKSRSIEEQPFPVVYMSNLEVRPEDVTYLLAKTSGNPAMLAESLRKIASEVNPDLVYSNAHPLAEFVSDSMSQRRFSLVMIGLFASVALILASIGLYSVISYTVSQRTHEIGIRMALGAKQPDVVRMVVKEGFLLSLIGLFAGLILSFASTRIMSALLYFVSPTDASIFELCSLFFLLLGLTATYLPARRAASVDPYLALRHE